MLGQGQLLLRRSFFSWLNGIFNKVDPARIAEVGPDRACAEWLLRCGAGFRWKEGGTFLKDYNALPRGNFRKLKIQEIDATDAAIMEIGFPYLENLTELKKIKLNNCVYITDDALSELVYFTKNKLEYLEVCRNGNITDPGLLTLKKMTELKTLTLQDLPGVEEPHKVLKIFRSSLPGCEITWPPFTDEG